MDRNVVRYTKDNIDGCRNILSFIRYDINKCVPHTEFDSFRSRWVSDGEAAHQLFKTISQRDWPPHTEVLLLGHVFLIAIASRLQHPYTRLTSLFHEI